MKIGLHLFLCKKTKVQIDQKLSINPDTWNLIKEKVESGLQCIGTRDHFLNKSPVAQSLRAVINKCDLKLKASERQRTHSRRENGTKQNKKRSSTTPHQTKN